MTSPDDSAPDWERIEADYRAGLLSLREIAEPNGITEGAVRKRAKRDGWERDLGAKIKAKADALVRKDAVRSEVRSTDAASEAQIVDANAAAIVAVRLGHRTDIRTGRELVRKLLAEVTAITDRTDLIESLEQALAAEDAEERGTKALEALQRVTSLPGRVGAVAKLAEALKNLVTLERQAWGLDEEGEKPKSPFPDLAPKEAQALVEAIDAIRRARTRAPA